MVPRMSNPLTPSKKSLKYAAVMHLVGLAELFFWPVVLVVQVTMWLMRDDDDHVDAHGRAIVNAHLSYFTYTTAGFIFVILTLGMGIYLFIPCLLIIAIIHIWGCIRGAIKASRGENYRYPLALNLI